MPELAVLFGLLALGAPVLGAVLLGTSWAVALPLDERAIARGSAAVLALSLGSALALDGLLALGRAPDAVTLAHWVTLPGYAVDARVIFDVPAAALMSLTALLTSAIAWFASTYLHRDPGYLRFHLLLLLFASGMMAIASAETLDLLFAGWEVVGLSSALLIAYFHTREGPVRNGLVAFSVYRICDTALLAAAVLLHHHAHVASFGAEVHGPEATGIAALIVFASLGKSAAFPFSGWLPRAMEGPTPSSAIFYGALSIHAGPFLLIRAWPLLEGEPGARIAIGAIGVLTALHAAAVGRAQTDVKSAIGYASIAQVGVLYVEIALGFTGLALAHLVAHAVLRTVQLLRAPSRLADWFAAGARASVGPPWFVAWLPVRARRALWTLAIERGYLAELGQRLRAPVVAGLLALDALDRRWTDLLAGVRR